MQRSHEVASRTLHHFIVVYFFWGNLVGLRFNLHIGWDLCQKLLELIPSENSAWEDKEEGSFGYLSNKLDPLSV